MSDYIDWDSDWEGSVKNAYNDLFIWITTRYGDQVNVTREQYAAFWEDFSEARATVVRGME